MRLFLDNERKNTGCQVCGPLAGITLSLGTSTTLQQTESQLHQSLAHLLQYTIDLYQKHCHKHNIITMTGVVPKITTRNHHINFSYILFCYTRCCIPLSYLIPSHNTIIHSGHESSGDITVCSPTLSQPLGLVAVFLLSEGTQQARLKCTKDLKMECGSDVIIKEVITYDLPLQFR